MVNSLKLFIFVLSLKQKDMELIEVTSKEKELIESIRLYKRLNKGRMLFNDFILYLRGIFEELLDDE